ncbi:hypothetical protein ACLM5J_11155 [Nocardioides sp. Bht2]|uniref:hypothetical protein n=1 Tax=Nocardioides sp. Bht2 TaxID=3392297 RepID=UPI0039B64A80
MVSWPERDPSFVRLRRDRDPSGAEALAARTPRVGLRGVLADLNRTARRVRFPGLLGRAVDSAYAWDAVDTADPRWWPQGITTSADAADTDLASRRIVLTSWYSKKIAEVTHGSRISVLDLETLRYRHVLLVAPSYRDGVLTLNPLRVHAGGIAWCGDYLHVAATGRGFATCHLDDIVRIPDHLGAGDQNRIEATEQQVAGFGHRYLLPVREWHRGETVGEGEKLRYSFLSTAHGVDGPSLIAGEYGRGTQSTRVARYALEPGSWELRTDAEQNAHPVALHDLGIQRMQGVTITDDDWYVTTSNGPLWPGTVHAGRAGALRARHLVTPIGPEDVVHWPEHDELWSVTEHPYRRWVFSMRRDWFS